MASGSKEAHQEDAKSLIKDLSLSPQKQSKSYKVKGKDPTFSKQACTIAPRCGPPCSVCSLRETRKTQEPADNNITE